MRRESRGAPLAAGPDYIGGCNVSLAKESGAGLRHADRFFIGGQRVPPWSDPRIDVIDSGTEELPEGPDRGYHIEPTVFGNVSNSSIIAQEEIFGPVLSVIPAAEEDDAAAISNDTIYGLNALVFTGDVNRARQIAGQLRSGTVGHNAFRTDFGVAFGGLKQSGIGREGGTEGLLPFLETKTVILKGRPAGYKNRPTAVPPARQDRIVRIRCR
jgi:Aldehyde dehydrogenase family